MSTMPPMAVLSCCKAKISFFPPKAKIFSIWTFHESFPISKHLFKNMRVIMIGGNVSQKETNEG